MEILKEDFFNHYKQNLKIDLGLALEKLNEIQLTPESFKFYTSIAVISSSRIEGEKMDIDSYLKHKMQDIEYLPELVEKPNDLFQAYSFAQSNELTNGNFLLAHKKLAEHLLPVASRGVYRQNEMLVMEHKTGRIQYEAAPYSIVHSEMNNLWNDIATLLKGQYSVDEIFYYASFIHSTFVNIHPFNDGNGRAASLLEKWFLSQKLGEKAWYIRSEKYYYAHVNEYYKNLSLIGIAYDQLDYEKADDFFQMLPEAILY